MTVLFRILNFWCLLMTHLLMVLVINKTNLSIPSLEWKSKANSIFHVLYFRQWSLGGLIIKVYKSVPEFNNCFCFCNFLSIVRAKVPPHRQKFEDFTSLIRKHLNFSGKHAFTWQVSFHAIFYCKILNIRIAHVNRSNKMGSTIP